MSDVVTVEDEVFEGSDNHNVGIITKPDLSAFMQSDVTSIALDIFPQASNTSIYSEAPAVASVIFDTLQTDGFWGGVDAIGYNFRHKVTQANLAAQSANLEGGRRYMLVYRLTAAQDGVVAAVFFWKVKAIKPV